MKSHKLVANNDKLNNLCGFVLKLYSETTLLYWNLRVSKHAWWWLTYHTTLTKLFTQQFQKIPLLGHNISVATNLHGWQQQLSRIKISMNFEQAFKGLASSSSRKVNIKHNCLYSNLIFYSISLKISGKISYKFGRKRNK